MLFPNNLNAMLCVDKNRTNPGKTSSVISSILTSAYPMDPISAMYCCLDWMFSRGIVRRTVERNNLTTADGVESKQMSASAMCPPRARCEKLC